MALSKANRLLMAEFEAEAAKEGAMIHEDEEVYITRRGEVRSNVEFQDKKKKVKPAKKSRGAGPKSSPGAKLIRAKQVVPSKAARGFTTKKPPKAYLSYPL